MTIIEMTNAMNEADNTFGTNYAGRYDISDDEAERIAEKSGSIAEFERIWEGETWWKDPA